MLRFALVTLVYNKAKFLKPCFKSTFDQKFKDFLHIVVNDGSTDNSDEVIQKIKKGRENIVYYSFKKSAGQMPRYNFVLKEINKKYPHIKIMGHLDGDDMLMPRSVKSAYTFINAAKDNVGHISTQFFIIDAKGRVVNKNPRSFPRFRRRIDWQRAQVTNNLFGHFRVMKIDCLNDVGGFDERFEFATDYNMACRMLDKYNVDILPKPLYLWRQHGNQVEGINGGIQTQCWHRMQKYYKKRWKV